jgi:hypothetical protein
MKKVFAMVAAIVSGASLFKVMVRSLILKA